MLVGGTPSSHGGGYPIQSWWGGVPQPVMVGSTPPRPGQGSTPDILPLQTWSGGYPGYPPPPRPYWGTPPPPSRPGQGTPPSRPGWGTPHHPDLTGVPPNHPDLARVPLLHHPDLAGVPPPTIQICLGYPPPSRPGWGTPPPSRCGLTNKLKTVPSPILRMRAVTSLKQKNSITNIRTENYGKKYCEGYNGRQWMVPHRYQ